MRDNHRSGRRHDPRRQRRRCGRQLCLQQAGADLGVQAITDAGGRAVAVQGDVSRSGEAKAVIDAAIATYRRLDILVNNSGVYEFGPQSPKRNSIRCST